ncbi:MAG: hypothetical protein NVS3B11_10900 [Collimonas sp.]
MGEIVDSVKRVTDILSEITAASEEQTAGIEQVNQAIMQMDQVTQQNAALVEEAAAAAASLQDQAAHLVQVVSVSKTDGILAGVSAGISASGEASSKTAIRLSPVAAKSDSIAVVPRGVKPPAVTNVNPLKRVAKAAAATEDEWATF